MKSFIYKILFFLAIPAFYFSIIYSINNIIIKTEEFPVKDSVSYGIFGDSHAAFSIDTSMISSSVNMGVSAEPLPVTYWKLKYISSKVKMKNILLSIGYHSFSPFQNNKFRSEKFANNLFNNSYLFSEFEHLPIKINRSKWFSGYFRKYFLTISKEPYDFIKKYKNSNKSNLSDIVLKTAIERHYSINNNRVSDVSKVMINYLDSIIQFTSVNQMNLSIVCTPIHNKYIESVPINIILMTDHILQERVLNNNVKLLDFSNLFQNDSYFKDFDHLNAMGALVFSDLLNDTLTKID